jgi:hypothetical protein
MECYINHKIIKNRRKRGINMKRTFALALSAVLILFIALSSTTGFAETAKYGFVDKQGNMVIPAEYDHANSFSNGYAVVFMGSLSSYGSPESGKYGFINTKGELIGSIQWDDAYGFESDRAVVRKNNKCGIIDTNGKLVLEPKYDYISSFSEGYAFVFNGTVDKWGSPDNGKYGFIDTTGKLISDMQWDGADSFHEGFASVIKNGKTGCIDTAGKIAVKPQYDYVGEFVNGRALVFNGKLTDYGSPDDGQYGFIDTEGKIISKMQWEAASPFQEDLAVVKADGKWGFIDRQGKIVVEPTYDAADSFKGGRARVFIGTTSMDGYPEDGYYSFIDTAGKPVGTNVWEYAGTYSEGYADIGLRGKRGYINQQGDVVISPAYDFVYPFIGGYAVVYQGPMQLGTIPDNGKYGMIDTAGKLICPIQWDDVTPFSEGMAIVIENDKWGFIDTSGKLVIDTMYQSADRFHQGLAVVQLSEAESDSNGDFRKSTWGMTRGQVEALEGEPWTTGTVEDFKNVEYIAYMTTVDGLNAYAAYYFNADGLFEARYIIIEKRTNMSWYIDDYKRLRDSLNNQYGDPHADEEIWDTEAHKSLYANDKGEALSHGFLKYVTDYGTDRTFILMSMELDNDLISTVIDYSSLLID